MSKLKVFSVHDSKAEAFNTPFMCATTGQAIRNFSDGVNDASSMLSKHAADFTLFQIAEYDDSKGEYVNLSPVKNLGNAVSFKITSEVTPAGIQSKIFEGHR